jgi:uncharacterized protein DUF6868
MSVEMLRNFLLWCTIINYGILLLWFLLYLLLRGSLFRLYSRWFALSEERINLLMFQGMTFYKLGIFIFNLTPLIALYIIK